MNKGQLIGIVFWSLLASYCLFCVFVPDIRIIYWKGTDVKMGTISYIGIVLFLWSPLLLALGIIPEGFAFLMYPLALIGLGVSFIGYIAKF